MRPRTTTPPHPRSSGTFFNQITWITRTLSRYPLLATHRQLSVVSTLTIGAALTTAVQ